LKVSRSHFKDLLILEPRVFEDKRGYFMESFNTNTFQEGTKQSINFVQDNESYSSYGIVRGIHFQKPPHDQAKLARVILGEVLDVIVDLRSESPSFGKHMSIVLSEKNKKQIFIPSGFGHGFTILSQNAIFAYKVNQYHAPEFDSGIRWDDPELAIDWKIPDTKVILSHKDKNLQSFENYRKNPCF